MHSSSSNIKITPYSDANDVIDEFFESLHSKYQVNLETSMRWSDFIFDSAQLMYYNILEYIFYVVAHILILQTG